MSTYWEVETAVDTGESARWAVVHECIGTVERALEACREAREQNPEGSYRVVKVSRRVISAEVELRKSGTYPRGMCRAKWCRGWAGKGPYALCGEHARVAERFGVIVDGRRVSAGKGA